MKLSTALGLYKLDSLDAESLPDIALNALANKLDSPSLRALAGEPIGKLTDLESVKMLFEQSIDELGLVLPNDQEAFELVAEYKCEQIVQEQVNVQQWLVDFKYFVYFSEADTSRFDRLALLGSELDALITDTEGGPLSQADSDRFGNLERQVLEEAKRIVGG